MASFSDFPLLPTLVTSLQEQGITRPTDIQARTLKALLDGRPLVGVSETGSGKTLAYVLPMLHQLKTLELGGSSVTEPGRPRGLVLVPGRELGEQVSKVFKGLTHGTRLRVRTVLGGSKKQIARQNVAGNLEIVVATPGRITQLLDGGQLDLSDVRMVVVDEADEMLDAGFLPTARRILGACRPSRQLVLFSATLPGNLEGIVRDLFSVKPLRVQTSGSQKTVPTLTTENRKVADGNRADVLRQVLAQDRQAGTLLFANTRKQCEGIAQWLQDEGIEFVSYWGQMDRAQRRANLRRFRSGQVKVLLATDLGGRGLDIERVDRVINVHLPHDRANYIHRVGRTARAGRKGLVVNLVTDRDKALMAKIQQAVSP